MVPAASLAPSSGPGTQDALGLCLSKARKNLRRSPGLFYLLPCWALSPACFRVVMLIVGLSIPLPTHSAPFLCHPHPLALLLSAHRWWQRPDVGSEALTVPGAGELGALKTSGISQPASAWVSMGTHLGLCRPTCICGYGLPCIRVCLWVCLHCVHKCLCPCVPVSDVHLCAVPLRVLYKRVLCDNLLGSLTLRICGKLQLPFRKCL